MSCPFAAANQFSQYKGEADKILATLPDLLDDNTVEIVKATAPAVAANIETITKAFYPHMFETHPCTKNYFNPAHQVVHGEDGQKSAQPFALAHAILRYVGYINNPDGLKHSLELAAQKHCALQVRAEHYPIVYECLMWAIAKVLGDAITPEIGAAWGKTVLWIARAFIERELEIYDEQQSKDFGWFGWKKFTVAEKRRDTDLIYTFSFAPADGEKLPKYEAGQYVTIRLTNVPGASAETSLRHYSVSSLPGSNTYSISVQVVPGSDGPAGLISNYLRDHVSVGDTVELGMPYGTFKLHPTNNGKPVALIAGGIGCTVTVSMLTHIVEDCDFSKLYFAHSLQNGSTHAYRNRVARIQNEFKDKIKYLRFYTRARPVDKKGVDFDVEGRITVDRLVEWMGDDLLESQFVLCGPDSMVHDLMKGLLEKGVPRDSIQFECFGPLATNLEQFVV